MGFSDIAIDGMEQSKAMEGMTVTERIALLNDEFRMGIGGPVVDRAQKDGMVVMTGGVVSLPLEMRARVVTWTACFGAFTPENDPHGEHDQASFSVKGKKFRWAFTYYAKNEDGTPDFEHGSEAPEDKEKTYRVLTLMTGEEY